MTRKALLRGGRTGFNALLGGGRAEGGQSARLAVHGFYWTASESEPASTIFYNFGHEVLALYRQTGRIFRAMCQGVMTETAESASL